MLVLKEAGLGGYDLFTIASRFLESGLLTISSVFSS